MSTSLYERVVSVDIEDSGINLSDHCAVVMELTLPLENSWTYESHCNPNKSNTCYKWRWDKADTYSYYLQTFQYLSAVEVPAYLLYSDGLHDFCTKDIQLFINGFIKVLWMHW